MWRRETRRDLIDFEDERGPGAGTIFYTTLGSDYIALRRREQFAENGGAPHPHFYHARNDASFSTRRIREWREFFVKQWARKEMTATPRDLKKGVEAHRTLVTTHQP
jgi:hypothetical protein